MKASVVTRISILLAVLPVLLAPTPQAHAGTRIKPLVFEGGHYQLPFSQFGYEVVTEGMTDYTMQRTMRAAFPFDKDLTILGAWGYTGDKLTITITDLGDTGDRLFACAIAVVNGKSKIEWGTMYSSATINSFEVTVPMESPGGFIYLLSGYFTPSLGKNLPYSYSITCAYQQ